MKISELVVDSKIRSIQYFFYDFIKKSIFQKSVELEFVNDTITSIFNLDSLCLIHISRPEGCSLFLVDKNDHLVLHDVSINLIPEISQLALESSLKFKNSYSPIKGHLDLNKQPITVEYLYSLISQIDNSYLRERIIFATDRIINEKFK